MKIGVLGLWHLGTVTAACTAAAGVFTAAVDDDPSVVDRLRQGRAPLFEPGLDDLVARGLASGTLSITADPGELAQADVVWICHDTPVDEEDHADVESVVRKVVGSFVHLRDGAVVLVSAQLPVGTVARLEQSYAAAGHHRLVSFACSPENLRLGRAIEDFRDASRIVVGVRDGRAREILAPLLNRFTRQLIWTSVESAEMTKHALNAFLAVSVTFTNEIAAICEQVGADASDVEKALRSEPRIGQRAYVRPGPAFAGGTLARDVQFLMALAKRDRIETPLIASVIPSNRARGNWAIDNLRRRCGPLAGRRVAVLGLAYKPGTDAIRRSSAIELVRALADEKAAISAFDPAVHSLPVEFHGRVTLSPDARTALSGAAAAVVATEWPDFRELSADDFATKMRGRLVLDPGRFLRPAVAGDARLTVISIGVPA